MIAIDWGTSSLRCYLLDANGVILDSRSAAQGILAVASGRFAEALESLIGDWISAGQSPIVMSGMIGSRQGWLEVPYARCPAGFEEIAAGMREVRWNGQGAWIMPGLACRNESGIPDVMRGEETQVLGALDSLGNGQHTLCLPGTHSKWVEVESGRILRFTTHMTGETFAVLKTQSILGRMMTEETSDTVAFEDGVRRAGDNNGLLHHLFGVRARGLFGEISEQSSASYLSGILIGHEIRAALRSAKTVHLLGSTTLAATYARAFKVLGIPCSMLSSEAAAVGLFRMAKHRKL
jgi:2-dehydro-3-deoxygalactonokinase